MYNGEDGYKFLMSDIMEKGIAHTDRTGTGTRRLIANTMRFDLTGGKIPVFTTKKVYWKGVVAELLWFLSGQTNINFLQKHKVKIWDEWADPDGDLGPVYGQQFRNQTSIVHGSTDPLWNFISEIKNNPDSRRHIISLWNAPEIPHMNLPPCHGIAIQASVINNKLYLEMYQRSCDMFLGVPFNVASYSLFAHMIAKECGYEAAEFIWHGHDCHIYDNHHEQVKEQLSRRIRSGTKLINNLEVGTLFEFLDVLVLDENFNTEKMMGMFQLENHDPHPAIKAKVAI